MTRGSKYLWLVGAAALSVPAVASTDVDNNENAIVITGNRPATEQAAGTKSATPLLETPQSISVISRDDLDIRGIANLNQALRYTAGITPETRGNDAEVYDQFKLRGFDAPRYLDGLKIFDSPTGYASTQVDTSRLDRIEVVKGPASVLYGQSSPGGLIALSSKLPMVSADTFGSVEATYGTFNLFRVDGDIGGKLTGNGIIRYRVSASINGADTQQTFGERRRYTISPAVTFGAGTGTSLTLVGNYSHDPENGNYGAVPLSGSLDANPNGRISQAFADGEPALTSYGRNQGSLTYLFAHEFGDWTLRANGRYQDVTAHAGGAYILGTLSPVDTSQTTFSRGSLNTNEHLRDMTFDNQLAGRVVTGLVTHRLLFGLDYQNADSFEAAGFGGATDINAFHPIYGTTTTLPTPNSFYKVRQTQVGVYAQDQIEFDGFRLTASGRYDWAKGHLVTTSPFGNGDDTKRDGKFTYRVGGLYLTSFGLAPYVSYSTSFEPQSGSVLNPNGSTGIANPSLGTQIEGGLKYQPPGTPILLTASYFKIDQTNVVVSNPISFIATQSGKVRSQGFEFEAKVPLFKGLNATVSFSRQNIRTIEDDNPFNLNRPLIGTAKSNGGVFVDYTTQNGPLQGFGIGGGVRFVGTGYGGYITNAAGTAVSRYIYTPSYTLVDAVVSYDLGRVSDRMQGMKVAINAANLFDTRHISSCYINGVQWCWYGQRRTVQGTIGYRW